METLAYVLVAFRSSEIALLLVALQYAVVAPAWLAVARALPGERRAAGWWAAYAGGSALGLLLIVLGMHEGNALVRALGNISVLTAMLALQRGIWAFTGQRRWDGGAGGSAGRDGRVEPAGDGPGLGVGPHHRGGRPVGRAVPVGRDRGSTPSTLSGSPSAWRAACACPRWCCARQTAHAMSPTARGASPPGCPTGAWNGASPVPHTVISRTRQTGAASRFAAQPTRLVADRHGDCQRGSRGRFGLTK